MNSLRIEVAEYHLAKGQLKEVSQLKEKINSQNKEIAELKLKAAEADKLRLRVEELENINRQYEQDIKGLKESLRIYSIKTDVKEDKDRRERRFRISARNACGSSGIWRQEWRNER